MSYHKTKPSLPFEPSSVSVFCPLCDAKYNPFYAKVIETGDDTNLLHSQCRDCGAYIISLVTHTPFGLSSVGIISDLDAKDVIRFKNQPKITCDDVIDFHRATTKNQKP